MRRGYRCSMWRRAETWGGPRRYAVPRQQAMKASRKRLEVLAIGAVAVALGVIRAGGDAPTRVSEVAAPRVLPPGAPKYSDVSLSSRTPHPRKAGDPYDTFEAARAFHATRLDWVNTDDADFVRRIHEEGLSYISLNVGANDQTDANGAAHGKRRAMHLSQNQLS